MKFVIIAQPRSGTSMLVNTLNSIDGFNVYGELFIDGKRSMLMDRLNNDPHPQKVQQEMLIRSRSNNFYESGKNINQFLDDLYKKDNTGFKLLLPHLKRYDGIREYIRQKNLFKIVLYRENKLNQVISSRTNRQKGKIHINPNDVSRAIKKLIQNDRELDKFCYGKFVKKTYEELTNDDDVKQLDLSWMGLGMVDVPLRKYKSKKLKDKVENYDDLISRAEFKKWL